jgi:hypothetical protein
MAATGENGMSPTRRLEEERESDGARPARGDTTVAQGETQSPTARQPHERDESVDSQAADNPSMGRIGAIAHDDVEAGLQDTTKGQELDATYHGVQQTSDAAPIDKRNQNQRRPR